MPLFDAIAHGREIFFVCTHERFFKCVEKLKNFLVQLKERRGGNEERRIGEKIHSSMRNGWRGGERKKFFYGTKPQFPPIKRNQVQNSLKLNRQYAIRVIERVCYRDVKNRKEVACQGVND